MMQIYNVQRVECKQCFVLNLIKFKQTYPILWAFCVNSQHTKDFNVIINGL